MVHKCVHVGFFVCADMCVSTFVFVDLYLFTTIFFCRYQAFTIPLFSATEPLRSIQTSRRASERKSSFLPFLPSDGPEAMHGEKKEEMNSNK